MVTIAVAVRILDKEDIGAFFFAMVLVQLVASIGAAGQSHAAIKILSGIDKPHWKDEASYLVGVNLAAATMVSLLFAATLPVLALSRIDGFGTLGWYCVPIVFLTIIHQVGLSILVGMREFRTMSLLTVATEAGRMALSVAALYFGLGVDGLLVAMIVSRILAIAAIWKEVAIGTKMTIRHVREREILGLSGWLYASSLVAMVNTRITDMLLTLFLGTATLAVYSTAMQIPSAMQRLFEAVKPIILSYLSSLTGNFASASIHGMRILSAMLVIAAGSLIIFAKPLITLLFSDRYASGIQVMQVLSFWMVLGIINYFLTLCLTGAGNGRKVLLLMLPQLAVMASITVPLVHLAGALGGAFALAISSFSGNLIGCWMVSNGDRVLWAALSIAFLRSLIPLSLLLALAFVTSSMYLLAPSLLILLLMLWLLKAVTAKDVEVFAVSIGLTQQSV